jgi:hypothetical protein|tara:strand:- start:3393 stop:3557 length:165 start_codon:yes stop_codon:yes gene_type:complete
MSLEDEAKKFMEGKKNSFPKRMEEIINNLKDIEAIAEITLKKLRELNAKNNSNS